MRHLPASPATRRRRTRVAAVAAVIVLVGVSIPVSASAAQSAPRHVASLATGGIAPDATWESAGPYSLGGILGESQGRIVVVQPGPPTVWVSDDSAATWRPIRTLPSNPRGAVSSSWIDPDDSDHLILTVTWSIDGYNYGGEV